MTTNFYFPGILCNNSNNNKELKELPILTAFLDSYTGNIRSLVLLLVPLQIQEAFPLERYQPREGRYQLNSFCQCCSSKLLYSALSSVRWQPNGSHKAIYYLFCQSRRFGISRAEKYRCYILFNYKYSNFALLSCEEKTFALKKK